VGAARRLHLRPLRHDLRPRGADSVWPGRARQPGNRRPHRPPFRRRRHPGRRPRRADAVTEAELQHGVIELARLLGYRVAHFRPALTTKGWRTPVEADGKGFPDLVLARPGRLIFAELKTNTGRATLEQGEWLSALAA